MTSVDVSIIIPVYNRSELFDLLSKSLVGQSMTNWEALVIDDGSVPADYNVFQKSCEQDRRFLFQKREGNIKGANACRNQGIRQATGRFIIFLDSDDCLSLPDCLKERVQFLDNRPDLDFCVSPAQVFCETPGDTDLLHNIITDEPFLFRFLKRDIPFQTTGPTWRRESLDTVGPWDGRLPSAQDWDFHIRALLAGLSCETTPKGLSFWRAASPHGSIGEEVRKHKHASIMAKLLTLKMQKN